jgi:hypothetical protein
MVFILESVKFSTMQYYLSLQVRFVLVCVCVCVCVFECECVCEFILRSMKFSTRQVSNSVHP